MKNKIERVLFSEEEIIEKCKELGKTISDEYRGKNVLLVGLLKGSIPFMAELSKYIDIEVAYDYMKVSSYSGVESTNVVLKQDIEQDIEGKVVLIIEDILDTGKTLSTVIKMLKERNPEDIQIVTLLDKKEGRKVDIKAKYVGFEIPNAFVVGFGLDYNERFRNLPYVGILKEEVYK